ncbi:ABC transporter ATP-binding protein [Candidatus Neomicrothrix sp.]|uniref:ABC transporter ATP-binding protein n=1 Tax=Candidatus Neomicrothrix sp. TaxID=2719034 RepID=UPI001B784CCA|nr:ABC transporter ATP-binding protein [Candidatus Microthrix sp.]MBP6150530.1 ABC transporter ATP-binding protein [Candidatus Microthrix sp.]MBP7986545.1 ABC transporter ATP-binding protein [Candidatus Microthrix sp.]MBP7993943.1 ABC transporter ATP-binding protein [Candidatus Microthrix sp.]
MIVAGSSTTSAPPDPAIAVEPILELQGIRAAYGSIEVLHGVDLAVMPGEVYALLGPNGAGKTTTLNILSGLMKPTAGKVLVAGRDVTGTKAEDLARAGMAMIPEGRGIFPNLTVRENLRMATFTGKKLADLEAAAYGRFSRLAERRSQVAGTMSGGEQQMLAMARGLATDPAVLILDELSMGLAPLIVEELYGVVAHIAADGVSIVVVEQFARTVLGVSDRAAIMVHGKIRAVGDPTAIEAELSSAYLGGQ